MAAADVKLRREVYRDDVEKMVEWLQDERVTRHLNEDQNIDDKLERLLFGTSLPIFSAQFNRDGVFFLITLPDQGPIGFLRLISHRDEAEVVIVIGERSQWGNGYGHAALKKALRHAFLEWRKDQVVAKIHKRNLRSRHVFRKMGFAESRELEAEVEYTMPFQAAI